MKIKYLCFQVAVDYYNPKKRKWRQCSCIPTGLEEARVGLPWALVFLSELLPLSPHKEGRTRMHLMERAFPVPILQNLDFQKPFLVHTNALEGVLGAVLSQEFNGEEYPNLYISRKLTLAETRYVAIEQGLFV